MVKKAIATTAENDVKKIDEIKDEVLSYAKERVDIEVQNSFKKLEKKVVKAKNGKILRRDLLIILLICLSGFFGYKLYRTGYFNDYFYLKEEIKDDNKDNVPSKNEGKEDQDIEPEKDLSFHSVALDNYYISSKSDYLKDYYNGNLTDELLLVMTLNKLDENAIIIDEDSFIINSDDLNNVFIDLYEGIEYPNKSFSYNGIKLKYLSSQNLYIALEEIKLNDKSDIVRYIDSIEENDDKIVIKTTEAICKDGKVLNILTNKSVGEYKDNESIKKYADKLNKLEYIFSYQDGIYKLISINKI